MLSSLCNYFPSPPPPVRFQVATEIVRGTPPKLGGILGPWRRRPREPPTSPQHATPGGKLRSLAVEIGWYSATTECLVVCGARAGAPAAWHMSSGRFPQHEEGRGGEGKLRLSSQQQPVEVASIKVDEAKSLAQAHLQAGSAHVVRGSYARHYF